MPLKLRLYVLDFKANLPEPQESRKKAEYFLFPEQKIGKRKTALASYAVSCHNSYLMGLQRIS